MRLPKENAGYMNFTSTGAYVAAKLAKAGLRPMAEDVRAASLAIKTANRAWEDAEEPVQVALAERDTAEISLDDATQTQRAALAGRDTNANKEAPYIDIFPDGIDYYTAARLEDIIPRYTHLIERLQKHLPDTDSVRQVLVPQIQDGLIAFQQGIEAVTRTRIARTEAADALTRAKQSWLRFMERVYAALIDRFGKKKAQTFFPKTRSDL